MTVLPKHALNAMLQVTTNAKSAATSATAKATPPREIARCRTSGAGSALAAAKPKGDDVAALLETPDPDASDLAALDAAWEDEPVNFGPGAGNGCKDGLVARLRAGGRPAPGMPAPAAIRPVLTRS